MAHHYQQLRLRYFIHEVIPRMVILSFGLVLLSPVLLFFRSTNAAATPPTITAVGKLITHNNQPSAATETIAVSPIAVGHVLALAIETKYPAPVPTFTVSSISGGDVSVWNKAYSFASIDGLHGVEIWYGAVTATGPSTVTVRYTSGSTTGNANSATSVDVQEFASSAGTATTWALDVFGKVDTNKASTTLSYPTLTPASSNEAYFGYLAVPGSLNKGSTPGVTYQTDIRGNQVVYDTSVSSTITPSATSASQVFFSIGVLLKASAATSDITPPTVTLTSPVNNADVSGAVTVTATAGDDVGVTGVDIYDGTAKLGSATLASGTAANGTWQFSWNTASSSIGNHTLTVRASDAAGHSTTSSAVTVAVIDVAAPTNVTVTSPTAGQTVSGTINLTATAQDNTGLVKFNFVIDTQAPMTVTSGSPASVSFDTTTLSNAAHTITATAYDAAGNSATSPAVAFSVNNTAPTGPLASGTLIAQDTFAGRTVTGGWGMASDGNVWTLGIGTASLFSVLANEAHMSGAQLATQTLGSQTATDEEGLMRFTTANFNSDGDRLLLRASDVDNFYAVGIGSPDGTPQVDIIRNAVGVATTLNSAPLAAVNNTYYWVRARVETAGSAAIISLRVWQDGTAEPTTWTLTFADTTPLTVAGKIGVRGYGAATGWNMDHFSAGNLQATADTTSPTVSLTSPANNANVSGIVTVTATAGDDVGVNGVDIYDGTAKLGSATLASGTAANGTWQFGWNTVTSSVGSHTLSARASDAAGHTTTSTAVMVTVTDVTAPTNVTVTSPAAGQTVSGTINLTATAQDNTAVTKFDFIIDAQVPITITSGSPATTSFNTAALSNAAHTIKATAYDAAGNSTTSPTVSFSVNNAAPTGPIASGIIIAQDTFAGRTATNGWGTASDGNSWTLQTGTSSMLSVTNGEAHIIGTSNGSSPTVALTLGSATAADAEAVVRFTTSAFNLDEGRLILRFSNANNYYAVGMDSPNNSFKITLDKKQGGAVSSLATAPFTATNNKYYWERASIQTQGTVAVISVRVWADGTPEPTTWSLTYTDSSPLPAGKVGIEAWDANQNWNMDHFSAGKLN